MLSLRHITTLLLLILFSAKALTRDVAALFNTVSFVSHNHKITGRACSTAGETQATFIAGEDEEEDDENSTGKSGGGCPCVNQPLILPAAVLLQPFKPINKVHGLYRQPKKIILYCALKICH